MDRVERRKFPRFSIDCPVTFSGETVKGDGVLRNLSREGGLIEANVRVLEGAYLELKLHLPEHDPPLFVELAAVRWTKGGAFGVQFMYMPEDEYGRLSRYITKVEFEATMQEATNALDALQHPSKKPGDPS
jgi:hypothetical protein